MTLANLLLLLTMRACVGRVVTMSFAPTVWFMLVAVVVDVVRVLKGIRVVDMTRVMNVTRLVDIEVAVVAEVTAALIVVKMDIKDGENDADVASVAVEW